MSRVLFLERLKQRPKKQKTGGVVQKNGAALKMNVFFSDVSKSFYPKNKLFISGGGVTKNIG